MKFNFKRIWQSALAGMVTVAIIAGVLSGFGAEMPGLITLLMIGGAGAGAFFIFKNNNWWI